MTMKKDMSTAKSDRETTSEMNMNRLAYPETRTEAALEAWKREMLLFLGGHQLA